ncbi:hypothetical protein COLO4_15223 [Corchorus olitorius]|uniref:Uncharacterized protein n=1 Tax=Corchorus olitorius TaxID=93759 RepID=A0A1R3JP05_9ROSI|nr:hypothetical protein COLO4_15223 [Corchorus olitorius]
MQKGKLLNFEFQDDESEPLDSKPRAELSSDDDEANEDLSLKIVEKALLMKAAKLNESKESASDDGDVVPVVNLASLSSPEAEIYVAGTSGVGDEVADLDLKSKKVVKRKKKKTKVEKQAIVTEDGNKTEMIKKVETVEEAAVGSLDPNTVDISDNIVLRKLLVS